MADVISSIRAPQDIAMEHPIDCHKRRLKPVNALRQAQGYGVLWLSSLSKLEPPGLVP